MMLSAAASALLLTSVGTPAALAQSAANQTALVDYVNPLMGTDSSYRLSYGNTYPAVAVPRSEEHTSELQSLMRISYAVFCLKKKKKPNHLERNVEVDHNKLHYDNLMQDIS